MKTLNKFLLIFGIIIAIPFIVALFVEKEYNVERNVIINKPKEEVFNYIKSLKNQDNFSKWASMDPEMKKAYRGTDGTVGFVSSWESEDENVGSGEQEITNIIEGERVDYELRFIKPWESTSPAYMLTEAESDNQTRITWGFSGKMDYPMNLSMLFMDFEKMIGDDLQVGLDNLKKELEK